MWRARGRAGATLFVVIGAQRAECAVSAGGQWLSGSLREVRFDPVQGVASAVGAPVAAMERLAGELREWCETQASSKRPDIDRVYVVIADVWLAVAAVPWSESLRVPAQSFAFARSQLEAAGHEAEASDIVRLDDASFGQPRLAVAYPALLLSSLEALARGLGANLSSVLPLSVAAWNAFAPRNRSTLDALAVLDEGMLLVAHGQRRMADVLVRTGADWAEATSGRSALLRQVWQRMRLRDAQLSGVRELRLLNLTGQPMPVDAAGTDVIVVAQQPEAAGGHAVSEGLRLAALGPSHTPFDVVTARPGLTPVRCAVAALALAVAAAWTWQAWRTSELAAALSQQVIALQHERGVAPRAVPLNREQAARVQAVNSAIRELNFPAAALLRALQPPPDIQVAVLSVDLSAAPSADASRASVVKIVAEARTPAAMARYVGFVGERKPFSGAYLTRHEIADTAPDRPYRFNVEAAWSE